MVLTVTLNTDPIAMPMPSAAKDTTFPTRQNATNRGTENGTPAMKYTMVEKMMLNDTCTGNFDTVRAA